MDIRPDLTKKISIKDFKEFYWLKEELIDFCRLEGLKRSGSKNELSRQIEEYLQTGQKVTKREKGRRKSKSKFDWKTEELSLKTKITDSYKNTEKVRNFFEQQIGKTFKFNVRFMNWMISNEGETLSMAIKEWKQIKEESKKDKGPREIAPQFEYNSYLRDFMKDNPEKSRKVAIEIWKAKKSRRGDNKYRKPDLKMKK